MEDKGNWREGKNGERRVGKKEENRRTGKSREGKDMERDEKEKQKGRKSKREKKRCPEKLPKTTIFIQFSILGASVPVLIPNLGQTWQVSAGQWCTLPCQISS